MIIEKEDKLFVTNVTILDTLQGIAKHLIISMMERKEGMYLYVSYIITLETQKDSVEWKKRHLIRNQNYKRNNRRNDDSLKEEMKDETKDFKETFMKAKNLEVFI